LPNQTYILTFGSFVEQVHRNCIFLLHAKTERFTSALLHIIES